ncbi:MAG: cohesin domain-containing protein [Dehalococcoidia bacterium]|nr:cohesin domain-containing protein [Dehalococcoidia bacterium]
MKLGSIVRILIIAVLAVLIIIPAVSCIKLARKSGATTGQVNVPVNANNASNLGSLEFEVVYNPDILQPVSVTKGDLADNAMLDSSFARSGRVWVAMVDSNGLSGSGSLAEITFRRVGSGQTAAVLTLENVRAYNATTLVDIMTSTTAGSLTTPPAINFTR